MTYRVTFLINEPDDEGSTFKEDILDEIKSKLFTTLDTEELNSMIITEKEKD